MSIYIALVGPSGSGKSEAAQFLADNLSPATIVRSSSLIMDELRASNQPITATTIRQHGTAMMQRHGADYWSRKIIALYRQDRVIVDGVRNLGGLQGLYGAERKVLVIALDAPEEVRLDRVVARQRATEQMSREALRRHLQEEMIAGPEWGLQIRSCMERADFLIDAGTELLEVQRQFEPVVRAIRQSCR